MEKTEKQKYQNLYYLSKKSIHTATIRCECNGRYSISNRYNHLNSNIHKKYVKSMDT